MTILNRLASTQNRKDEQLNIELACELVSEHNREGIEEVVHQLSNKDKKIRHDCIKVVYEIGKRQPELIAPYAPVFIQWLQKYDNRMIWGSMQALSTIAHLVPDLLMEHLHDIQLAIKNGSVITVDKGIITLGKLAASNKEYNEKIVPFLIEQLKTCRTKEVPQHAESSMPAVTEENKEAFLEVLNEREPYLSPPQRKRVMKLIKMLSS